ncbi:MAG: AAA family ATPase [Rhodocyclaceae bacterium]|nr:AAA family ATPase [Rhodocyclaceae bacterium]MBX3667810.1 AAA family ATPase [Rhodocyclaceae bacterium]
MANETSARLAALRITHFKSIGEARLDRLGPVTVLVGPNAAGKSNLVDALRFLRDVADEGLEHALSDRGGITLVRQAGLAPPPQVGLEVDLSDEAGQPLAHYALEVRSHSHARFRIAHEAAEWAAAQTRPGQSDAQGAEGSRHRFERDRKDVVHVHDGDAAAESVELAPHAAALGVLGANPLGKWLREVAFCTVYPDSMRDPRRPDSDERLKESGENWATVLRALRKTEVGRVRLEQVRQAVSFMLPGLEEVTVKSVGGYLVPQFMVRNWSDRRLYPLDPVRLSTGTLRLFGMLLAVHQLPAPALAVIEEPEQSLNPQLFGVLVQALRQVSRHTQIIITTHSPQLVDMFEPEEIRVVSFEEGSTRVASVHASQIDAVKRKLGSLGEYMAGDGLQPDLG